MAIPGMRIMRSRYQRVKAMPTKDGSLIRELMHPAVQGNANQSFAEATLDPGQASSPHRHLRSEEIYHFLEGRGVMRLGEATLMVEPGDTVCIPPGTSHSVDNSGGTPMRILCCCAPPYSQEDTELL